jgi:integrase
MSAARKPSIPSVGVVDVFGPNPKGYYRLKWSEPDGTPGDTTAGRILEPALEKAAEINERVSSAAGPKAVTTLDVILAEYLLAGHSPYKDKKVWKPANKKQITDNLSRCLRGFEHLRAMDVNRDLCDRMRAQAGTETMVRINTNVLRAFLHWGQQHGYLTPLQAELLPRACSMPAPIINRVLERVDTNLALDRARMNGQAEVYIRDEDAPSRERIVTLAVKLKEAFPLWGDLAVELAANSGPRWGEQFQLAVSDVHLDGCAEYRQAHIHVDWQVDAGGTSDSSVGRRVRPKGDKTRVIAVSTLSFTGFRLRESMRTRTAEALREQEAGTNPEALIFCAPRGGMLWYSAFNSDYLLPAMKAAGWPVETWVEKRDKWDASRKKYTPVEVHRRRAGLPWHSLRHRFARICVDIKRMPEGELMAIGGWENINTVQTRYYRSGKDNMERGLVYFD